jgi:hypothetical protein
MLAYIGPGPGLELVPQFLALLAFAGTAILAVLLWPVTTVWRMIRGNKQQTEAPVATNGLAEPGPVAAAGHCSFVNASNVSGN